MARLQATIDDNVMDILDNLLRRNDRARFIEFAIKAANNNPEIKDLFSWKQNKSDLIYSNNFKEASAKKENITAKKIQFDDEFEKNI